MQRAHPRKASKASSGPSSEPFLNDLVVEANNDEQIEASNDQQIEASVDEQIEASIGKRVQTCNKKHRCTPISIIITILLLCRLGYGLYDIFSMSHKHHSSSSSSSKISENKYYAVVNKALNYSHANGYCVEQYGTSLATIFDIDDNNVIHKLCNWTVSHSHKNRASNDGCWIGYTKLDRYLSSQFLIEHDNCNYSEWFWIWYNKSVSHDWELIYSFNNFTNWNGNAYDQEMKEDAQCALLLNANGTWNSDTCVNKYRPFVCNYYAIVKIVLFFVI